nr:uncharacterized protein LOC106686074 [Halyomorpha halys]
MFYDILVILRQCWTHNFIATGATREIINYEGEGVLDLRTAPIWFEIFSNGDTSFERKEVFGRPLIDIDKVLQEAVESNPSSSTRKIDREYGVSKYTVSRHNIHGKGEKEQLAPHELTSQINNPFQSNQRKV